MNSSEFIASVGKLEDAPEVQRLLAAIGFTKKLKMPKDDIDVRASVPKLGLSLVFEPKAPKSSRLIMSAVKFISAAEKGNTSFSGELPAKLLFSDLKEQARAKLGPPVDGDPDLRLDIWDMGELRLAVKYAKDAPHPVGTITVQLPSK